MAGEWLKFECSLPEKPETLAITIAMGWDDPDLAVGKLMRLFRWFDQQTIDGNAPSVSAALLDRIIGVSGFVQAVADVGWIVIEGKSIHLANFDRHNGATAKSRAQTAKRVANHKTNATANAEGNARTVSEALPREEKRREEPSSLRSEGKPRSSASPAKPEDVAEQVWTDWQQLRKGKKAAVTETVLSQARSEAEKAHLSLNDFLAVWCARGSQGLQADWLKPSERGSAQPSGETAYQRSMRERMQQFVPGIAARAPGVSNVIEMETADVTPRRLDR